MQIERGWLCPAICETYPPELRGGLPVIASPMASPDGHGPDPYDPEAFARAVGEALASPSRQVAPDPSITSLLAAFA